MNRLQAAALAMVCAVSSGCHQDDEQAAYRRYQQAVICNQPTSQPSAIAADQAKPAALPQVTIDSKTSLQSLLAYAALHNPALEAQFYRWQAALQRVPQVRSLPDPQFSYRYYVVEQMFPDGNMRNMYQLTQTFPWPGRLQLRGDVAAAEADAEYQRLEAARLKLANDLTAAYYELYYLEQSIVAAQDNLRLLESIERQAAQRYSVGQGTQAEVLKVQVETGKLQNELVGTRDMRAPAAARVNALLCRPADAPLPTPAAASGRAATVDDKLLLCWLEENNPEIRAMNHEIAGGRKSVELAGKDYFPDLMLGYEYGQMVQGEAMEKGDNPQAVMLSMNVPIWWNKYAAGVREARYRVMAAQKDKADKINALSSDLKMATYRFRDAQRRMALYRDALIPRARQAVTQWQAAFRVGQGQFQELLDSQRILLEFQLAYQRALADRAQRLAEVEMIVGKPVPSANVPATQPVR